MGNGHLRLINAFITSTENTKENIINPDSVDKLIDMLTDFYVFRLENGLIAFKDENIKLNNEFTKIFFIAGLNCLRDAITIEQMECTLDFLLLKTIREKTISSQELFEVYLLTKIMPTLQPDNDSIKKYFHFIRLFCSNETQHLQLAKFIRVIDIYNITDSLEFDFIKNLNLDL
jgi:hypothetical protein